MNTQTDSILIDRCRNRDLGAYRELVERYKKQAYGFAFSYLRNTEDALAVSQDAFVRAWRAINTFKTDGNFKPWLFSIVKNLSLNLIKKKQNLREVSIDKAMEESGFDIPDRSDNPLELLEKSEIREQVWKAVMKLKPEFREVIVLKHFHDLSYNEIAEAAGILDGTVMSRLYHARLALRKSLEAVL